MKVLLIGGSGQLGQSLQKIEWDTAVELIIPSSKELDVTVSSEVSNYIAKLHPSFVINASAWTNVPAAEIEYEKALKINSEAVRNIAISCNENKSELVHVSTDYVFDGTKGAHTQSWIFAILLMRMEGPSMLANKELLARDCRIISLFERHGFTVNMARILSRQSLERHLLKQKFQ